MLLLASGPEGQAQETAASPVRSDTVEAASARTGFFRSPVLKALAVPAVLVGYGASTVRSHGFYSSYLGLAGAELAGVPHRHDSLNTALLLAKAEMVFNATVFSLKYTTHVERPSGKDDHSFPSDHAAQAFLAASIVDLELRDRSRWYGVGAYGLASSVAVLRVFNNKHWESDVFAGAGLGILSAHVAYLTHRNRWGRRPVGRAVGWRPAPAYWPGGTAGFCLHWRPSQGWLRRPTAAGRVSLQPLRRRCCYSQAVPCQASGRLPTRYFKN